MSDMFTGRLRSEIPQSLEFLSKALEAHPIELLDFSDNAFGPDGLIPLIPLISALKTLKELRLNNTGLGPRGGLLLAESLLALRSGLETLIVGRSRLEDGSMGLLSDSLSRLTTLTKLSLPQNGIRPDGIVILMQGLAPCPLQELDLQDNTFTLKGSIRFHSDLARYYPDPLSSLMEKEQKRWPYRYPTGRSCAF